MLGHGYFKKQPNQDYLIEKIRKFLIRYQGHRFYQVASPSAFTADHQEELRTMAVAGSLKVARVELSDYQECANDTVKVVSYMRNILGAIAKRIPVKSRRSGINTVSDALNTLGAILVRISSPDTMLHALSTNDLMLLESCQTIVQKFIESTQLRKKYPLQFYNFFKLTKGMVFYKLNVKSAMNVEAELSKRVRHALIREKKKLIIMHTVFADLTLKKGEFKSDKVLAKSTYGNKAFVQLLYDLNMALRALVNTGASFDQAIQAVSDQDWSAFKKIAQRAKVGLLTVNEFLAQIYAKWRAEPNGKIAALYNTYRQQLAQAGIVPLDATETEALASINLMTAVPA
jgi:hypothetical protein